MESHLKIKLNSFFADIKGVQGFWLTAFKNVELLASMIQEHDEPILEHLSNVKVDFSAEPMVSSVVYKGIIFWLVVYWVSQCHGISSGCQWEEGTCAIITVFRCFFN